MRKLEGTITAAAYGNGGARLTIKTPTGENFTLDLSPDKAEAFTDQMVDLRGGAAAADAVPVTDDAAPAKSRKKK